MALLAVQTASEDGPAAPEPVLRRGSRGDGVRLLQDHLIQANASIAQDGIFGPITKQAVVAYQGAAGLAADGVVGPRTWASLKTGGVRIPATAGGAFGESGLAERVVARLNTVASHLGHAVTKSTVAPRTRPAATQVPVVARAPEDGGGPPAAGPDPVAPDGSVAAAATRVGGLLAQVANTPGADVGPAGATTGTLVDGLLVGTLPLDQAVIQLDTVSAQLGEHAANTAGAATGTGTTTVRVVSDTTYKITGDTIADVGSGLSAHMATHGEAAHVAPHTRPDGTVPGIDVAFEFSADGKVARATVTLELDRVLPEWTKASTTTCTCWKQEWDRFDAAIRAHEQEHVNIFTRFLTGLHLKFVGKTQAEADAVLDKEFKATEQAQADFDTRTTNGMTPPPGTRFNAGLSCTC